MIMLFIFNLIHFMHIYITMIDFKKQQPLAKCYKIWCRYVNTHTLNLNLHFYGVCWKSEYVKTNVWYLVQKYLFWYCLRHPLQSSDFNRMQSCISQGKLLFWFTTSYNHFAQPCDIAFNFPLHVGYIFGVKFSWE